MGLKENLLRGIYAYGEAVLLAPRAWSNLDVNSNLAGRGG